MALLMATGEVRRGPVEVVMPARLIETHKLVRSLADAERDAIESAMILCEGNIAQAALGLGISRRCLYLKLANYGARAISKRGRKP